MVEDSMCFHCSLIKLFEEHQGHLRFTTQTVELEQVGSQLKTTECDFLNKISVSLLINNLYVNKTCLI